MPETRSHPGYVLKKAREALGLSVEEVATGTDLDLATVQRMENGHAWTKVCTVMAVHEFLKGMGVVFVYGDGHEVTYLRMPDGRQVYVDGSDLDSETRGQDGDGRPKGDTWEQRIVRTSWGYWVRPKDEE